MMALERVKNVSMLNGEKSKMLKEKSKTKPQINGEK